MRTIYWNFYRIDNVNQMARVETFDNLENINTYALDLISKCAERAGDRKRPNLGPGLIWLR